MFSRQRLVAEMAKLAAVDSPPLEIAEFGHMEFHHPGSEQYIWAVRGTKRNYVDGLLFWIKSLEAQHWEGREQYFTHYAGAGLCEPISKDEFVNLIAEYTGSLREPPPEFLRKLDGYKSGLRMYHEWNDVAAVAELAESFIAFYWSTSA